MTDKTNPGETVRTYSVMMGGELAVPAVVVEKKRLIGGHLDQGRLIVQGDNTRLRHDLEVPLFT